MINGEYRLAYSGLSGNMITNNYLTAAPDCLHIKREGGFEGELLFDPMTDTVMKYRTIMLECAFSLHTCEYTLTVRCLQSYGPAVTVHNCGVIQLSVIRCAE